MTQQTKTRTYNTFMFQERMREDGDIGLHFLDPGIVPIELRVNIEEFEAPQPKGVLSLFSKKPAPLVNEKLCNDSLEWNLDRVAGGHKGLTLVTLDIVERPFKGGKETRFLMGYCLDFAFGWDPIMIEEYVPLRIVRGPKGGVRFQGNMILTRPTVREYDDGRPSTKTFDPIDLSSLAVEKMFGLV